jgi:hypothetical protein
MQTYYRVLEFLNTTYSANLEELFKLPKIKGNFKGEHTPMFNRGRETVLAVGASSVKQSVSQEMPGDNRIPKNASPPSFSGWMKREEGTIFKKFNAKYFTVNDMMLTCSDGASSSETVKSSTPIRSTTTVDTIRARKKMLQSNQLYISDATDSTDLLLEANTEMERDRWAAILQKHIDYALVLSSKR